MNYCASKAALHHFILCLREQLCDSKVNVVEIYPPAVQSEHCTYPLTGSRRALMPAAELHNERHQPDIKNGRLIGMPLSEFTDQAYEGLVTGNEDIPIGRSLKAFDAFEKTRMDMFYQFLGR
jgi:short-subunit dehydrogenase involved in D-alanine esterification of teichoic acids